MEEMLEIRPFKKTDLEQIRQFTDREIGAGYYSQKEIEDIFERSQAAQTMCSLVLVDGDEIKGIRISYPPKRWKSGKGSGLHPEKWPHTLSETGYFQSIFIASSLTGQGWGGRLSMEALRLLSKVGAKGVVCHAWKESPNNSSTRYLSGMGFEVIAEHKLYWKDLDYKCTKCGLPPCQCTAQEMYLDLEKNK
jgi:predicted N-acetyltransferase YhbS